MRVVIFWTGVTGAMASCWRALSAVPGVQVTVFSELHRHADTAYAHEPLLAGIDCRLRYADEPLDREAFAREIAALAPDVMVILGWRSVMCRFVAECPAFRGVPKLFAFDMPFAFTLRKLLAPLLLRRYLRRFVGALVPGERSAVYARYLGFSDARIEKGLAGLDTAAYAEGHRVRTSLAAYPRQFLFVGRYAREKGLDVLVDAYREYRRRVSDPWGLTCCGMGAEGHRLAGVEGVRNLGFVQPADLPDVYARHGAFVLASRHEPWGFVIQEAVASGLPVVCTAACGAHVELVHSYFNGRVVGTGDVASLAEALEWIHTHEAELPAMAARGLPFIAPYAKEVWATRLLAICRRAAGESISQPRA